MLLSSPSEAELSTTKDTAFMAKCLCVCVCASARSFYDLYLYVCACVCVSVFYVFVSARPSCMFYSMNHIYLCVIVCF